LERAIRPGAGGLLPPDPPVARVGGQQPRRVGAGLGADRAEALPLVRDRAGQPAARGHHGEDPGERQHRGAHQQDARDPARAPGSGGAAAASASPTISAERSCAPASPIVTASAMTVATTPPREYVRPMVTNSTARATSPARRRPRGRAESTATRMAIGTASAQK